MPFSSQPLVPGKLRDQGDPDQGTTRESWVWDSWALDDRGPAQALPEILPARDQEDRGLLQKISGISDQVQWGLGVYIKIYLHSSWFVKPFTFITTHSASATQAVALQWPSGRVLCDSRGQQVSQEGWPTAPTWRDTACRNLVWSNYIESSAISQSCISGYSYRAWSIQKLI